MIRPSVQQIIDVMKAKGHTVYNTPGIDWNLNIVGIRSADPDPGAFNDTLTVFHQFRSAWDIYWLTQC